MKDQILLSHDRGWFHVGERNGGEIKPYTYLFTDFIPMMLDEGIPKDTIDLITRVNPGKAYTVG
jgi:phosphotriesterase-related protein